MPDPKRLETLQDGIQSVVNAMMERVLNKVLYDDPFLSDKFKAEKPPVRRIGAGRDFQGLPL